MNRKGKMLRCVDYNNVYLIAAMLYETMHSEDPIWLKDHIKDNSELFNKMVIAIDDPETVLKVSKLAENILNLVSTTETNFNIKKSHSKLQKS